MNEQLINAIVELSWEIMKIGCFMSGATFFIKAFVGMVSDIICEITDLRYAYKLVSENKKLKERNEKLEMVLEEMGYILYE